MKWNAKYLQPPTADFLHPFSLQQEEFLRVLQKKIHRPVSPWDLLGFLQLWLARILLLYQRQIYKQIYRHIYGMSSLEKFISGPLCVHYYFISSDGYKYLSTYISIAKADTFEMKYFETEHPQINGLKKNLEKQLLIFMINLCDNLKVINLK